MSVCTFCDDSLDIPQFFLEYDSETPVNKGRNAVFAASTSGKAVLGKTRHSRCPASDRPVFDLATKSSVAVEEPE